MSNKDNNAVEAAMAEAVNKWKERNNVPGMLTLHEGAIRCYEEGFEDGFEQASQQWVAVSERLPEQGELFLICYRNGRIDISGDPKSWSSLYIVAWMPLPAPYAPTGENHK